MDWFHDFGAWLFFHEDPITPFALFGFMTVGWWVRIFVERRSKNKEK